MIQSSGGIIKKQKWEHGWTASLEIFNLMYIHITYFSKHFFLHLTDTLYIHMSLFTLTARVLVFISVIQMVVVLSLMWRIILCLWSLRCCAACWDHMLSQCSICKWAGKWNENICCIRKCMMTLCKLAYLLILDSNEIMWCVRILCWVRNMLTHKL